MGRSKFLRVFISEVFTIAYGSWTPLKTPDVQAHLFFTCSGHHVLVNCRKSSGEQCILDIFSKLPASLGCISNFLVMQLCNKSFLPLLFQNKSILRQQGKLLSKDRNKTATKTQLAVGEKQHFSLYCATKTKYRDVWPAEEIDYSCHLQLPI